MISANALPEIDPGRNHTVDFLKGIAICMVIITHYEWTELERHNFLFPYIVDMAIPIFMILTGYTYSLSNEKHCINTLEDAYSWKNIRARFIRYTVPFFILIIWELFDSRIAIVFDNPLDYVAWILRGTDGPGSYYYPILLQLILVLPILNCCFKKWGGCGALIACFIANLTYELMRWAYAMNAECYRLLVFRYIFVVGAGIYTYKGYRLKRYTSIIMVLAGAVYIFAVNFTYYHPVVLSFWTNTNLISVMIVIPIMNWLLKYPNISFKPLELVGRASYHIFLVQMVYYLCYYSIITSKVTDRKAELFIGLIICILIGIGFYLIEKPITTKIINRNNEYHNKCIVL